jgi:predicted nucleic acid-binding protein
MYLFDTDVIITLLRPRVTRALRQRFEEVPREQQFVSSITIAEMVYGARKSARPQYHLRKLQEVLLPNVNILDFEPQAAYYCGEIRAELESNGTPLAFADLQIGAIALAHNLVLVTGNVRHFNRIPDLRLQNWLHPTVY